MVKSYLRKTLLRGVLLAGLLASYACATRYNTIEQEDPHMDDPYVYGEVGGPPKQADNQYPADPKQDARANAIREKMFGASGQAEQGN